MFMKLMRAYAVLVMYFVTLFLLAMIVTAAITMLLGAVGNMSVLVITGTIVTVILAFVDFSLMLRKNSLSPVVFVWTIPVLIYCVVRAVLRKEPIIEYDVQAPVAVVKKELRIIQLVTKPNYS